MKTFTKKSFIVFLFAFIFTLIANPLFQVGNNQHVVNNNMVLYDLDFPLMPLNNQSLREVFEEYNLFDSEQLVTNGDFINDFTGWSNVNNFNTLSTTVFVSSPKSANQTNKLQARYLDITSETNDHFYISIYMKNDSGSEAQAWVFNKNGFSNGTVINHTGTTWTRYSRVISKTGGIRFMIGHYSDNNVVNNYYDDVLIINISQLKINKQYSPLYETTFDLMSDSEIKEQMDLWVQENYGFIDYDTLGWYPTQYELQYFYDIYTILKEMGF